VQVTNLGTSAAAGYLFCAATARSAGFFICICYALFEHCPHAYCQASFRRWAHIQVPKQVG